MALVDEKGRFPGRWNPIDVTALVVVALLLIAAAAVRLRTGHLFEQAPLVHAEAPVRVELALDPDMRWLADRIRSGDRVEDVRRLVARVEGAEERELSDGSRTVIVTLWLRARRTSEGLLMYKYTPLRIGDSFRLAVDDYMLSGHVYGLREAAEEAP